MRRRLTRLLLAVAALGCLVGCRVSGTVDVTAERATVDVTVTSDEAQMGLECSDISMGSLRVIETAREGTGRTCRVQGTIDALDGGIIPLPYATLWTSGDLMVIVVTPGWHADLDVDLRVTAPGPVELLAGTAEVDATTLHLTDGAALSTQGFSAIARLAPGSARGLPLGGAVAGLAAGFTVAFGGVWLARWLRQARPARATPRPGRDHHPRRGRTPEATPVADPVASPVEQSAPAREPPPRPPSAAPPEEDPSIWAPR